MKVRSSFFVVAFVDPTSMVSAGFNITISSEFGGGCPHTNIATTYLYKCKDENCR
jgi:hypothetical protein